MAEKPPVRNKSPRERENQPRLDREAIIAGLKRYLDTILRAGHFNFTYDIQVSDGDAAEIVVNLDGPDRELLLERGGELLQALEHVAVRWLRLDRELHDRVRLDCGSYHADRLAELQLSAKVAAQRVRETRSPFRFNPMSAADRRVIHVTLSGAAGVRTTSEGVGDRRHVVILPESARETPARLPHRQ
jgi:spoIIIJ-associated protein